MSYRIPGDPHMLCSFVNMQLRDSYDSLDEFCAANEADKEEIIARLAAAGYKYDESLNQFR